MRAELALATSVGVSLFSAGCAEVEAIDPFASSSNEPINRLTGPATRRAPGEFEYRVTVDGLLNNNSEHAGRPTALRAAERTCELDRVPTPEEIDLTRGFSLYLARDYYFRCPTNGEATQ